MGLIDIDDRDVYNYYQTNQVGQPQKFKEWLGRLKAELPGSIVNHLGDGIFKIDFPAITCTGVSVTTIFNIPFMHQFQKMEIKHVDSANADSVNLLNYSVSHRHHPNLWMLLLNVINSIASDIIDEYIGYFMDRGNYKLITNSTNTELLHISMYIRVTGD